MAKKEATIDAAALKAEFLGVDAPNKKEVSAETTSKGIDAAALRAEYLSNSAEESDADPTLGLKIGGMATRAAQHNLRATMRSAYNRKSALDGIEATDAASQSVANMVGEARKRGYMEAEQKRLKPLYDYLESEGDAGEGIKPIDFTQSTLGKSVEEMMPKSGQYIPRGKALLDIMDKNSGVTDKSEMYNNTDRLRAMYMLNPNMAKDSQHVEWNEHYPAPTTPIMTPSEDGLYHIGENTYTHEDMVNALSGYMPVAQHNRLLKYNEHYRDDYARSLGYKSWDDAWETPLKNLTKELEAINEELASETYDKMVSASAFETAPATEGTAFGTYIADMMRGGLTAQQELEKAKSLTADDFISGFDEGFNTVEVMSLGYAGIGASVNLYNILEKVNNGQALSEREEKVYRAYEIGQELEQLHNEFRGGKRSRANRWGKGVGTSTEAMAQFAASMAATGGIGSGIAAANTGIKQAFKQGLKSGLKQTVKMGSKKAGVYGARSAAAASFSPMTYSTFADRRVGQYHIDESGNLVKETRPWAKDLGIAYVETFNEYFSEYFGDGMGKLIDVSPSKIGRVFGLDKWAGKKGYGNIGDYLDATFVPTKRMREAMHHVDFAGFVWEAPSEAFGDFMSSLMLAPFSEEHGFEQFATKEYWEDLYGTTAIFGGSLSVLGAPATIKNMYNTSKNVKRREAALGKIQDVELRNNLKSVMSLDSMEEMSQAMVDLHIERLSPDQAAAAVEYLTSATMVKVLTGADMENTRLLELDGYVKNANNVVYKGKDGSLPSDEIIKVVDKNGRELYVVAGDVNNTSDVSMLKCKTYDAENRKWVDVAVPASEVMGMKRESVEQVISAEYERMFGTEIMAERLKEIEGARKSMEDPSAEVVRGHYLRNGLKVYDTGAEVSLADGRTAVVESILADGSYLVRSVNPITQTEELYEVPFMQVLQPEASLAEAQKQMFAKNIESATQSIERAEATEQSADAGMAEDEDVDADMEDVVEQAQEMPKPVPTREDGSVDFSAIEDPKMFATEYTKKMGVEDKAKASVAKMAANARAEASQLREKSDKMTDPNEVVDAVAKADAMDARADFYDKVLAEYAPQEEVQSETYKAGDVVEHDGRIAEVVGEENEGVVIADAQGRMTVVDPTTLSRVAEAPAEENAVDPIEDADDKLIEATEAGIVQNVFGKMLDARTANVIDAMAKALGVKVAFVESVTTQAGTRANADIKGNVVRIAWAQRRKAISFLAGHEFTHRMKDMSPEAYAEFTKSVKEYLGEAEWQRRMNAQRATYELHNRRAKAEGKPLLSYEDALLEEEVVADFVGDMVESRHAFEHYVQKQSQKPSLLQAIKKVLSAIGRFFRRMGARTEAQRMKEMIAHLDTFINKAREEAKKKGVQESDARFSLSSTPIFFSNAQYAVQNIKQEKATPEQWLKMIEKNGGLKAGEDKWLGLSDWLKASDKKTLTKDEVLQYIAENDIQIEEVEYAQFGPGLIDEATRKLEAEMREIGIDAMREKYNGFDDLFEVYNNELVWSENMASESEYEDFIIGNNIVDVNAQANAINETRSGYTTNGLTNKREIALVVPTIEPYNAHDEVHFGDAGGGRAVAWIRFGETTDADGKRVLVIDEIQSKRHQDGREKGYISDEVLEAQRQYDYLYRKMYKEGLSEEEHNRYHFLGQFIKENYGIVPSAPFEKNWAELAFKRMLRYAAENGYDYVAWTTGDQQAKRYDLSKKVDSIIYKANDNGTYRVSAILSSRMSHKLGDEIPQQELSNYVGKELADRIINSEGYKTSVSVPWPDSPYEFEKTKVEEWNALSGGDLKVGGEGMRGFYDQMLPSFVKKYTKKWGAEVGEVTMPDLEENNTMHAVNVTDSMRESVMQGQPKFSLPVIQGVYDALKEYEATSDIETFVNKVRDVNDNIALGHPFLTNAILDYDEFGAEEFERAVRMIVGDYDGGGYAPYTAGDVKFSLQVSAEELAEIEAERQSIIETAKANGTYLKAPNGKGTNLTPEQWVDVRTSRFKKWFGDWTQITQNEDGTWNIPDDVSKVIDTETGEPKVVYHGSVHNFTEFKTSAIGNMSGDKSGFYFTNDKDIAKSYYSKETGKGLDNILVMFGLSKKYKPTVYEVFLNAKNPLNYELKDVKDYNNRQKYAEDAKEKGYDAIFYKDVVDGPPTKQDVYVVYSPNQIKSADPVTYDDNGNVIPLSERFNPRKEDIRYSLIGEVGASNIEDYGRYGSPMFNLEMARELEAMGKSAKKIRLATNWERGADGKWRFEIMDGTYNHPTDDDVVGKTYALKDILDNDYLFEAYPDLADMTVVYDPNIDGWGAYNGKRIVLNPSRTNEEMASILLHEVQHAIQHREMFARGGNESMMEKRIAEEVEKLQQEFNALGEEFRNTSNTHLLRKAYLLYQGLRRLAKQGKLEGSEYEAYRRLAGEVEARNVQKRMGMSEDERLNTMLEATEDVARKDQEVLFREAGVDADAQEAGYRYSIEEIIDTPSDEEYKQQMLELAQQMERDAEERNLDKAQEIADVTGWVHLDDGTWQYYGNVDITEDAKESTRVRRWLESKAAVKKARTRKMYDDLLKEQKKVVKELESESKARRSNASYAKAVDAILQGQAHEALPIEDQILVDVALGQKLRWEDEQGGSRRGLKTELGLRSTTAEGMAEVTGGNTYIEDYVAAVVERNNGYENGIDDNDVRNAVIEVFGSYPSRKAALAELSRRYPDTALNEATEAIAQLEQERDDALAQIDADLRSELADAEANPSQYERAYEEEGTWNLQFDIYTGALRKARNEVSRMGRDMERARLTQQEKTAAMRTVKRAVVDMLKGDLGRYTRKRDIQVLMDAVNEAQTLYAMQRAIDKAMLAINELRLRKETARMNNLLKMRISSHDSAIDPRIFFENMMKGSKNVDSAVRRLMNDYWRGVNSSGIDVAKGVDGDTARVLQFIRNHSDLTAELGKAPTEGDILKRCEALRKELRGEAVETSVFSDTERKEIEALSPEVRERMADAVSVIEGYLMVQYQLQNMDEGVTNARQEIAAEKAQIKKLNKEIKALQGQNVAVTDGRIVDAKKEIEERKKKIEQINRDIASVRIMNAGVYIGVMPDILDAFSRLNAQVESLLMGGRVDLADFRAKRDAHKRELVNMVLEALDNPEALDRNKPEYTAWQKAKDTGFVRFFTNHLGSLDYMLRSIDRNAPNGEGMVHTYFTTKLADAKDAIYENSVKAVDILNSKAQALFGTAFGRAMRKAERKVLGTMSMTRTKKDGTKITEEYEMTVATALYTMMMWNQPASRPALENMGATEEDIEQLRTWLNANNPAWLQFAGWVVNDFLPSNRARYNEVYRAMNGTDMDFAENYFPIRRMSTAIPKEVDLADPSFENKPSTVTGAIMKRTENKLPIDLETSFFGALQDNIVEMEEWSALAPIISDFNAILSSPAVKKTMDDMGEYFHNDFQQAAKVATLKYAGDTKKLDGVFWQMVYRTWASAKLAFKAFTALKQLASSVLFLPYSAEPEFIGRLVWYYIGGKDRLSDKLFKRIGDGKLVAREVGEPSWNIKWALENSSMFRRRWDSGVAGNDIFTRELKYDSRTKAGRFVRSISETVDWLQKMGMAPIAFIDAYTVAAGMRAIYDFEMKKLLKEGYTKEEAKKIAMRRAEMIANKSQQSSEGEYLAPLQMERGWMTSLTMFQNAPFAQGRNIAEAWTEITRKPDKEYAFIKKQEIARMKKARAAEYEAIEATIAMEKELGIITTEEQENLRREKLQRPINAEIEAQAHTATKTKIVRAKIRAYRTLAYNAFRGQFVFNLMGKVPYLLFGDDDEEKKKTWIELAWLTVFAPVGTFTAGGTLMSILGGHKVSFSGALSEFEDELNKIISEYKNDGFFEAMLAAGDFLIRKGFGVDYETFMRMYAGIENMFESGMSAENIFMALNAPDSQVRLLAGDRKEGETAQEYATRIMRLYSIFSNPEYSDYYNEKFSYRGENPAFLMSDYMARSMKKNWEMAYRSDVMRNKGLAEEWAAVLNTEEEYEEVVEALGFKANKKPAKEAGYIDGEYRAPIEGLSEDDFDDLKYLAWCAAEAAKYARTYLGGDEDDYLEYVRDEMEAKRELISEYNKILNK